jgi:hypothetical protein
MLKALLEKDPLPIVEGGVYGLLEPGADKAEGAIRNLVSNKGWVL